VTGVLTTAVAVILRVAVGLGVAVALGVLVLVVAIVRYVIMTVEFGHVTYSETKHIEINQQVLLSIKYNACRFKN